MVRTSWTLLPGHLFERNARSTGRRFALDSLHGKNAQTSKYLPEGECKQHTPESAALGIEQALRFLEGRWKLEILFRLFGGKVQRFSELERSIPGISQKMLTPQLRQMERDGIVRRIVHHQVPPKVEYCLTDWGQALCPVLDELLKWAERRGPRDGTL